MADMDRQLLNRRVENGVKASTEQIKERFLMLMEYVSCEIVCDEVSIKFTQSLLLQSYEDEFKCKTGNAMILKLEVC